MKHRVTDQQLKQFINAAFFKYDKNKDGYLDVDEITLAMAETFASLGMNKGVTDNDVKDFFKNADVNLDGKISTTELFIVFQKTIGQYTLETPVGQ